MAKIPFDIKYREQIESKEYRVVTREGKSVNIIYWERKGDYPIVALVDNAEAETVVPYRENGRFFCFDKDNLLDLFIITPEQELTEFEKEFDSAFRSYFRKKSEEDYLVWVKARAAKLLDLAREEIEKTLPKWKKCEKKGYGSLRYRVYSKIGGEEFIYDQVGGMEIPISELEKLPSEED